MLRADAKNRLSLMVAAGVDPVLTDPEIVMLLDSARRPDTMGRLPGDTGWVETYALGAAAAEGWRWKAARVVDRVDLQGDDTRLSRSQLFDHCMRMADRYDRQAWAASPINPDGVESLAAGHLAGWGAWFEPAREDVYFAPSVTLPGASLRGDNSW